MSTLELWQIYGSRQDTDAAVIRELERRVNEAETKAHYTRQRNEQYEQAITAAGFRFVSGYSGRPPALERIEQEG